MPQSNPNTGELSFEKVWQMFQETDKLLKELAESSRETDKKFQETDKLLKELAESSRETDRRFQETDKLLKELVDQSAVQSKELKQVSKETKEAVKKLTNLFTTQWGKLMETLVEPSCLALFRERGIDVTTVLRNLTVRDLNRGRECDLLLINTTELVVVEVKTTCRPDDVSKFLENLRDFKSFFPAYSVYRVMGAVAALKYDADTDVFAARQGLFVLQSGGGIMSIKNSEQFTPKLF